jgi:hypothetical protein
MEDEIRDIEEEIKDIEEEMKSYSQFFNRCLTVSMGAVVFVIIAWAVTITYLLITGG